MYYKSLWIRISILLSRRMKISYKQRLFIYFFILLSVFTCTILLFESTKNKKYKTEALEEKLDAFASIIYKSIINTSDSIYINNNILEILPKNIRISIIDNNGNLLDDNVTEDILENHLKRKEIVQATNQEHGSEVRTSTSNNQKYLYFARKYPRFYVRVALPYDWELKQALQTDNIFLFFILLLSLFILGLAYMMANRFGKSINKLRDFALNPSSNLLKDTDIEFPDDELGVVAEQLINNYKEVTNSKLKITLQREKLLQHIHTSDEGICFFNAQQKVEFYNGLFIYHLNTIIEHKSTDPNIIFKDEAFGQINSFLSRRTEETFFETEIKTESKQFNIRVNLFEDNSFEVILIDVTKLTKTRLLKQEMTSNIAHELRTPITSIRGYLETIVNTNLQIEQIKYFANKAYQQSLNLNQLVEDMSIITKIDEALENIEKHPILINDVIREVTKNLADSLQEQEIELDINIPKPCQIDGNRGLIYSIFKNLIENSIKHGGHKAHIHLNCYNKDKDFYYFSYYDEGASIIDEIHLNRLFERFYRVSEGRTRKTGGTGLGLAIVKNAILVHKGTITAKKRKDGRLEFLFKLKKS